jgi:hypothetical protein
MRCSRSGAAKNEFVSTMPDEPRDFRWLAVVTYRGESGPIEVDHYFEELGELHDLIERGPDWNTIETIVVRLNPRRASYPDDTVEKAADR